MQNGKNERLKVEQPKSLVSNDTEHMYLPRNDKFEGYSQFPRPRIPTDAEKIGKGQQESTLKKLIERKSNRLTEEEKEKIS